MSSKFFLNTKVHFLSAFKTIEVTKDGFKMDLKVDDDIIHKIKFPVMILMENWKILNIICELYIMIYYVLSIS